MKIALTIGADTTDTHCGACSHATINLCMAFSRRLSVHHGAGPRRLPECLAAEREHAAMVKLAWRSHAFVAGSVEHGYEMQCSEPTIDGMRHCGYPPEWHVDGIESLAATVDEAMRATGPAWMHGGVSLAEGIRRKTAAMERLAMPAKRARPGATLTVERADGTSETTTFGGDR